jgi:hypothetical protein
MQPGLFNREWSVIEQRRQELLAEVATTWLIRNALADNSLSAQESSRSRLGTATDIIMRAVTRPSARPLGSQPCSLRDGLS